MPSKVCNKCFVEKPLIQFPKDKTCKDGHLNYCKDCKRKQHKQYFEMNPEACNRRKEKNREYKNSVKSRTAYYHWRKSTPDGIFLGYKANAKRRGILFELTKEQFKQWFNNTNCVYCGDHIPTIGLDRMNNNLGYILGNIAFCCSVCNLMKKDMSIDEFEGHIIKLFNHLGVSNAA